MPAKIYVVGNLTINGCAKARVKSANGIANEVCFENDKRFKMGL